MRRLAANTLALAASTGLAPAAHAQLWNALDTHPKANMIIGFDTSVTMAIESDCSDCHKVPLHPAQRLVEAKRDILRTLPLFEDVFVYGGFLYSGAGYAKVRSGVNASGQTIDPVLPDPTNLPLSYQRVDRLIRNADTDRIRESYPPGGFSSSCLTPASGNGNCPNDAAVINQVLQGGLQGIQFPSVPSGSITCTVPNSIAASLNPQAELRRLAQQVSWPRYASLPDANELQRDVCTPLQNAGNNLAAQLAQCIPNPATVFDMSQFVCNAQTLSLNACAATSPLANTCLCNPIQAGCFQGAGPNSCGNRWIFPARQQAALCAAYDPGGLFGPVFRSQADNVVHPSGCRENALLLFTDGCFGDQPGVNVEAPRVLQTYRARSGASNSFVFRVATPFVGSANYLADQLQPGLSLGAYDATDGNTMLNSFAQIVNRILQGQYTGSNLTFDRFETRVAIHTFTVPGQPFDTYLGRPSRISWHEVDPGTGAITATPIFETDWTSKVGVAQPINGMVNLLGPNGTWRNNLPIVVSHNANTLDRNGDGSVDQHPAVTWGYMLGGGASQPVIVEAPREIPIGADAPVYAAFSNTPAVRDRPRVIYALSNGYLHAIHAGERRDGFQRGQAVQAAYVPGARMARVFYYDDSVPQAGTEIFRYRPGFPMPARAQFNDVVQQDIVSGQITVREVHMSRTRAQARGFCPPGRICAQAANLNDFATVLVFGQGKGGPGYAAINVSDPYNATPMWEYNLPGQGDRATAEPMIYQFPGNGPNPMLVVTGGVGGSPSLYAINITNGQLYSQANLPRGIQYRVAPICLDATGAGVTTHCYVLGGNGTLLRVPIDLNGQSIGQFGPAADITPAGVVGAGREFWTRPAVYFGKDNAVNIVFGSGDVTRIASASAVPNAVYKVVDRFNTGGSATTADIANVCQPDPRLGTRGVFPLQSGEMVVSPPIVGKGVVAWTTYTPGTSGCVAGRGRLFAVDFETCVDLLPPVSIGNTNVVAGRGSGRGIGAGIHTSPSLLRSSEQLVTYSSADPSASATRAASVKTEGGDQQAIKKLYWRPVLGTP